MLNITVIGANSYIARNLVYLIKQQLPDTQLFLYDAADTQIDGLNGYEQIDILSKESVKTVINMTVAVVDTESRRSVYNSFSRICL